MSVYLPGDLLAFGPGAADRAPEAMNARTKALKQLVRDSRYVVDPHAVAEAIVERSTAGGGSWQPLAVPQRPRRAARLPGAAWRRRCA